MHHYKSVLTRDGIMPCDGTAMVQPTMLTLRMPMRIWSAMGVPLPPNCAWVCLFLCCQFIDGRLVGPLVDDWMTLLMGCPWCMQYNTLFQFLFTVRRVGLELQAAWGVLKQIRCGKVAAAKEQWPPVE